VTEIKFCGMTRIQDATFAASLGVHYVGCVFAGGPRQQTPQAAAMVFSGLDAESGPRRAGVFADNDPTALAGAVRTAGLHVVQLHGDPSATAVARVRTALGQKVWAVVRCQGGVLPDTIAALWDAADAVLLDAYVPGRLGGSGTALPWSAIGDALAASRRAASRPGRLVIAGGLTPDNVGQAIAVLRPDVVDTSSGIESAPGIKDPARMAAFVQAVGEADRAVGRPTKPFWSES
jgi:phosphoribosylanthranilate isomerase